MTLTNVSLGGPAAVPNHGLQRDYSELSPAIALPTVWNEPQPPAEQLYDPPLRPPAPHVSAPTPPASYSCLELKDKLEQALKLNFVDLFEWDQTTAGRTMVDRRAMLLFHPLNHAEELEIITRWLLMHHVEVSSAWYEGSWDYFRQQTSENRSGIILVGHC
jgi:chromo domain-containing protein 1